MVESVKSNNFGHALWDSFTNLLVILAVVGSLLLVSLRLCGYNFYTVMSGSMEPVLNVGSVVFVKPVNVNELKSGDIISYVTASNHVVTHRVTGVNSGTQDGRNVLSFPAKGDAKRNPNQ